MEKFELCKRAGLELQVLSICGEPYILAADIEKLLAEASVVHGRIDGDFGWYHRTVVDWHTLTHTARLIMVEPIKKDTAKSLLREAVEYGVCNEWIDRARRLLGEK